MNQEEIPEKKEQTGGKGEPHLVESSFVNKPKIEGEEFRETKATTQRQNIFLNWNDKSIMERSQILLFLINIASLVAFICVSSYQISLSNRALNIADSSNAHARQSIGLAKQNALSSDTINRKSLAIADSSLALVKRNNEISNKIAKMGIRPQLIVKGVRFTKFIVGEKIECEVVISNYGKTPAQKTHASYNLKIGGTGIYGKEFFEIMGKPGVGNFITSVTNDATDYTHHLPEFDFLLNKTDSIYVQNGTKQCFFLGYITYIDLFNESHTTTMCYKYNFITGTFVQNENFNTAN